MKRTLLFVSLTICLLIAGSQAKAQGVGASGDIKGSVTDPSGALVSKATVTVTDAEKGIKRSASTDTAGQYVVTGLSPSTYQVSAQFTGFDTEIHKGIVVNVGQTTVVDFHLAVAA